MTAEQIMSALEALTVADFGRVKARVLELDAHFQAWTAPPSTPESRQQALEGREGVTYRQDYTRCGKERCKKCAGGNGHGPYWYAYWSEGGKTKSKYIGKELQKTLQKTAAIAQPAAPTIAPAVEPPSAAAPVELVEDHDTPVQVEIVRFRGGRWHFAGGRIGNHYTLCGTRIPEDGSAAYKPYQDAKQVTCSRCHSKAR